MITITSMLTRPQTFEFTVQAFSAKFTIKKSFAELLELHMEVRRQDG